MKMVNGLWVPPSSSISSFRKTAPPKVGEQFGDWAGRDISFAQLPGGGLVQFDLSRLTMQDFRQMRDHPQVNASLAVLTFMLHQLEWKITGGTAKSREFVQTNIEEVWNRLVRFLAQSFWAGYSPGVLQWENDVDGRAIKLDKIKDLIPEECRVNWKEVPGYAPPGRVKPKFKIFDGINQASWTWPIPVENSLWYPLLMENGDHYGRKLLRPAFTPWFFSILMHLFTNRYFERFGEPVPVGRADFDDDVEVNGNMLNGRDAMLQMLTEFRNRAVVVLPSDRQQVGASGTSEYTYDIEYLESQMRGADFDRYLDRLDNEISIGLFTPANTLKGAEQGYNTTVGQMQMYFLLLNAVFGDVQEYINKYIVRRLKDFNWGPNHPDLRWEFRRLGKQNVETMRAVVASLMGTKIAPADVNELGEIIGLSLKEIKEVQAKPGQVIGPDGKPQDPAIDPEDPASKRDGREARVRDDQKAGRGNSATAKTKVSDSATAAKTTRKKIVARLSNQIDNAMRRSSLASTELRCGYRREIEQLVDDPDLVGHVYSATDRWLDEAKKMTWADSGEFRIALDSALEFQFDSLGVE